MRLLRWLPSVLLLVPWLVSPLQPSEAARVRDLASSVSFRLLDWETQHVAEKAGAIWTGLTHTSPTDARDPEILRMYFAAHGNDRTALRSQAEAAMQHVVGTAYREGGLTRQEPVQVPGMFPPVLVTLTQPPNVLVIAPRTALRVTSSSVLQAMDVPAQERLERSADSAGVSSLVAPIGGIATYPSMVLENDSADQVLSSVAHEWVHQYLIFYPLGEGYWNSQETREINETTAEMVGTEVGGQVAARLGLAAAQNPPGTTAPAAPRARPAFDFRAFMRETRSHVEEQLAAQRVDAAEAYMNARRDELQQHGYYIRKLNQAYFALYGSYGEGFAASPANPIPGYLRTLRAASPTLADFMVRVRDITSVAQLREAAERANQTDLPA